MPSGDDISKVRMAPTLFVALAALLKVQWFFPPTSSLMRYYHLHSVKFGRTTEGINDSHWIKQQLRKRKHSSLWRLNHDSQVPLRQGDVFEPLSPWDFANLPLRILHHCCPHLKSVLMQFQNAFLDGFQGAQELLVPPLAQRLAPTWTTFRCLPASLHDSIFARRPCLDGWLNNMIDLSWLPAFEIFENTQQPYHFYLLST